MQKKCFCVQKKSGSHRRIIRILFPDLLRHKRKCSALRAERKSGPSREEPFWIFQKKCFWKKLRNDCLDGESRKAGLPAGGGTAQLCFNVINAISGIKGFRNPPR